MKKLLLPNQPLLNLPECVCVSGDDISRKPDLRTCYSEKNFFRSSYNSQYHLSEFIGEMVNFLQKLLGRIYCNS